mmetsp:Transcript_3759/g.5581  ORF Transcript_3759/g.5581 Transcript_3759/m.5581 type:complete len:1533 (-) Transcript_3759:135-4733(-)|eukprot:CAMPEP_0167751106 /NCGR_PEP_ID=MMETSP0110_2-20121227/6373_1 /TAXON_ID=629695 /ORGANISM="Gymnochlora sp., Strain CCMP2014" /LENGTH=1532 /DNA_ID=CAMNT_0007636523 /DNA_START=1791 /DNA_END=6389 /DNA_ORIENTATION=+
MDGQQGQSNWSEGSHATATNLNRAQPATFMQLSAEHNHLLTRQGIDAVNTAWPTASASSTINSQANLPFKRKMNTSIAGNFQQVPVKRFRGENNEYLHTSTVFSKEMADQRVSASSSYRLNPPTSGVFDEIKEDSKASSARKKIDDAETDDDEIEDLSMPIFLGSGRYFVPKNPLHIQMDYASDGFGRPPLGTCIFDAGNGDGLTKGASRVDLVPQTPTEEAEIEEGAELELPRAFSMSATEDVPSVKWRRSWGMICTKLVPKEIRRVQNIRASREGLKKRLLQSLVKELRKRAAKNFRGLRDSNMRAKRLVRDMQMYWRKYEKEVAENRRRADKMETERRKTDSERQERERQQKKLEFLLTQTELFSHFIGKKMGILPPDIKLQNGTAGSTDGMSEMEKQKILQKVKKSNDIRQKAAQKTKALISQHYKKTAQFDKDLVAAQIRNGMQPTAQISSDIKKDDLKDMDLLNPSTMPRDAMQVKEPDIFNGKLKSYQKKGLNWLANLYEQGINGILADEMGLGKTIQSIAFMAHLCEAKGIWGPFLVIAPNSTLHQWQQEISKFCPTLNVLPYWGSQKERKIIRKYWKPELLYKKDAAFHLLITSYHVVVADEKHFGRLKWHYMLLDEAQAIKNASSLRWKSLLNLKCRNRLLLTGTPIQNSMAELWALLHFIMPDFFDSHEEFNEWFSKDIQGHAQGDKKRLDAHQLQRLHMILKPFMLRRVKKDVEHEMAPKIEVQVNCPLSARQKKLYDALKNKISMKDLLTNTENLMNIVMQFRKVCNHPEIFERRSVNQPFCFIPSQSFLHKYDLQMMTIQAEGYKYGANPISFPWPKLLDSLRNLCRGGSFRDTITSGDLSIFHAHYIHNSIFKQQSGRLSTSRYRTSCFAFTRFMDMTPAECSFIATSNIFYKWLVASAQEERLRILDHGYFFEESSEATPSLGSVKLTTLKSSPRTRSLFSISPLRSLFLFRAKVFLPPGATEKKMIPVNLKAGIKTTEDTKVGAMEVEKAIHGPLKDEITSSKDPAIATSDSKPNEKGNASKRKKRKIAPLELESDRLPALIQSTTGRMSDILSMLSQTLCFCKKAIAPPPVPLVQGYGYKRWYDSVFQQPSIKEVLVGGYPITNQDEYVPHSLGLSLSREEHTSKKRRLCAKTSEHLNDYHLDGLNRPMREVLGSNTSEVKIPNFGKLLSDSGKLCTLDSLLRRLRVEGHRVLIFSQMTKMIDILEDYMRFRKIKFFRLDGQTSLADRRDMVREFQSNPEYFVFLLSTRAGGLGINLTAADTVIFYDNDWNPTMDAQAMDRVHRIGQTKQVTVYRLVCKNTVEERILKRAQVKHTIQKTVYAGGFKMQGVDNSVQEISMMFKANELRELVLGDEVKDQLLEEKRKKEAKQKQLEEERRERREKEKAEKKRQREEKEKIRQKKALEKQKEKEKKAKERQAKKEQKEKEKLMKKVARQHKKTEKTFQAFYANAPPAQVLSGSAGFLPFQSPQTYLQVDPEIPLVRTSHSIPTVANMEIEATPGMSTTLENTEQVKE